MMHAPFLNCLTVISLFALFIAQAHAAALAPISTSSSLSRRTVDPYFPDTPTSCPICQKDYASINSCALACPVLANFTMIIFSPSAFIDVIKCACTDTFQAVFPQCVDCFVKTGQDDVIESKDLPGIVDGMRKICALESTLLGNVSGANGYFNSTTTTSLPTPTASTSGGLFVEHREINVLLFHMGLAVFMGLLGL